MDRFNRERSLKRDKLYRELKHSLEYDRLYMRYFQLFHPSEENAHKKTWGWCKLCRANMEYYQQDGGEVNLKCHVRYHISLIESEMGEELQISFLHRDLLENAEKPMGFADYFNHHIVGDSNESMDREGVCKLCGRCVEYTLYESMEKLRAHFQVHVNKEKERSNDGSGAGSSSNN